MNRVIPLGENTGATRRKKTEGCRCQEKAVSKNKPPGVKDAGENRQRGPDTANELNEVIINSSKCLILQASQRKVCC